jgi:hypothetical protein
VDVADLVIMIYKDEDVLRGRCALDLSHEITEGPIGLAVRPQPEPPHQVIGWVCSACVAAIEATA